MYLAEDDDFWCPLYYYCVLLLLLLLLWCAQRSAPQPETTTEKGQETVKKFPRRNCYFKIASGAIIELSDSKDGRWTSRKCEIWYDGDTKDRYRKRRLLPVCRVRSGRLAEAYFARAAVEHAQRENLCACVCVCSAGGRVRGVRRWECSSAHYMPCRPSETRYTPCVVTSRHVTSRDEHLSLWRHTAITSWHESRRIGRTNRAYYCPVAGAGASAEPRLVCNLSSPYHHLSSAGRRPVSSSCCWPQPRIVVTWYSSASTGQLLRKKSSFINQKIFHYLLSASVSLQLDNSRKLKAHR